jgi:hypothetical protein
MEVGGLLEYGLRNLLYINKLRFNFKSHKTLGF